MSDEFKQPTIEGTLVADPSNETALLKTQPVAVVDNSGKTDELSLALIESRKNTAVVIPDVQQLPGKYALDYSLQGVAIHETHSTVALALARIADLARLGIVPATSTNV